MHLPSSMFPKDADAIGAKALAWFLAGRTPAPPAHTLRGCLLKGFAQPLPKIEKLFGEEGPGICTVNSFPRSR